MKINNKIYEDVTSKYEEMLSAFEADFYFAKTSPNKLQELQRMIDSKDKRLMEDIDSLSSLEFKIRRKKIIILEEIENE